MLTSPPDADPEEGEGRRRSRRRSRHRQRHLARAVAAAAALGAALAGAEPTGTSFVDPLLTAAFAAAVTLAASRSRRWPVMALPLGALLLASGWLVALVIGSGASALAGATRRNRERAWGAVTAALALQVLLRAPGLGPHGFPSLVTAAAVAPALISGYKMCRPSEQRRIVVALAAGAAAVVAVGLAYVALVVSVAKDIDRATVEARSGLSATRRGESDVAQTSFARSAASFERVDRTLNSWWAAPARAVPVLAQHAKALGGAAAEGHRLTLTADETVEAADYQELRYTSGRFDLNRVRSIRPPLARTIESIAATRRSLAENDSGWLLGPLASGLDELDEELARAQAEADLADHALAVAPDLLGANGPRRYFVAFVTPAEVRGSGGFMGSWAEITAEAGELHLTDSGPVRELSEAIGPDGPVVTGPPDYLARYGRFSVEQNIGDFTFSPHFPDSAQVMAEIYPQAGRGELDGVVSIDPVALAALLNFTGPLDVEGFDRTLTAKNAAEFLLRDNYSLFEDSHAQNEALARLVETTFDELTTGDLPSPRELSEVLSPSTREGRIRMWSPREEEQALFDLLGATGAFPERRPDHDFFALSSQNTGNNKIDVYQSRSVDYVVEQARDGSVRATATVTIRNDPPLDGSVPDYVVGNSRGDPPGSNRMLLSVHTPHQLEGATLDGQAVGMESQSEGGFAVYSRFVVVPAGGEVTLELRLHGEVDTDGGYVLDLAPHPMVTDDDLTVRYRDAGRGQARLGPDVTRGRRSVAVDSTR